MEKKIKLSKVQQFALMAVNEKVLIMQNQRRSLAVDVTKELGIPKEELEGWKFAEDFSFIEKLEKKKK